MGGDTRIRYPPNGFLYPIWNVWVRWHAISSRGSPEQLSEIRFVLLDPIKRPWLQVYIDDILIFSDSPEERLIHIQEVMAILAQNDLYSIRSEKCQWMRKSLVYLGFTIQGSTNRASGGIKPSIKKIQAVTDWEIPKNVRNVYNRSSDLQFFIVDLFETIPRLHLHYII